MNLEGLNSKLLHQTIVAFKLMSYDCFIFQTVNAKGNNSEREWPEPLTPCFLVSHNHIPGP